MKFNPETDLADDYIWDEINYKTDNAQGDMSDFYTEQVFPVVQEIIRFDKDSLLDETFRATVDVAGDAAIRRLGVIFGIDPIVFERICDIDDHHFDNTDAEIPTLEKLLFVKSAVSMMIETSKFIDIREMREKLARLIAGKFLIYDVSYSEPGKHGERIYGFFETERDALLFKVLI